MNGKISYTLPEPKSHQIILRMLAPDWAFLLWFPDSLLRKDEIILQEQPLKTAVRNEKKK